MWTQKSGGAEKLDSPKKEYDYFFLLCAMHSEAVGRRCSAVKNAVIPDVVINICRQITCFWKWDRADVRESGVGCGGKHIN